MPVTRTKRAQKQADVTRFIDLLLQATEDSPLTLVFTVRADFYDQLLQHDRLTGIAQDQQISLGPLTEPQLRDCIEQPARKIGLDFEDGLVDRIVRDVGGDEGKLPLLEYALKGTWENSRKAWSRGTTDASHPRRLRDRRSGRGCHRGQGRCGLR